MTLKERLFQFIADLDEKPSGELDDNTPLISSGLLNSLSLFRLAEWIEKEVERPITPTELDLRTDWDTVGRIVEFVEKHRG